MAQRKTIDGSETASRPLESKLVISCQRRPLQRNVRCIITVMMCTVSTGCPSYCSDCEFVALELYTVFALVLTQRCRSVLRIEYLYIGLPHVVKARKSSHQSLVPGDSIVRESKHRSSMRAAAVSPERGWATPSVIHD
jgi:hypothetical protein